MKTHTRCANGGISSDSALLTSTLSLEEGMHRGSSMSAHVLLNLFSKLRKRDKMRGLPSILSLFRNEFIRFRNTGARMLYILFII